MPVSYLLDTNIVSYILRGNFPAVRRRILHTPVDSLAISTVTEAELRYWALCRPNSPRTQVGVADFLARVQSLPWDSEAAIAFAVTRALLKRNGQVLSSADLMIAAHALSRDLTLVTHDRAFEFVVGLKTEDWTSEP
jgi:tRNA(fMet)-specific endonuclease VapC